MSDVNAKMHQIRFPLGLYSKPCWGAYSAPPDLLAGGLLLREGKGKRKGRGRRKNEGEERGREGKRGGEVPVARKFLATPESSDHCQSLAAGAFGAQN